MDLDRSRGYGVRSGRIILLGDGTEVIPDQSEEELFEQSEEEHEPSTSSQESHESSDTTRNDREGTPGPQTKNDNGAGKTEDSSANISESPASTTTNNSSDRNNNDTSSTGGNGGAAAEKPSTS